MTVLSRIQSFLLLPLALVMLVTGISPVTATRQQRMQTALEAQLKQEFVPVFRFAITSDVHVKADDLTNANRLAKLFETAYQYSDSHPTYTALDAVLLAGDNVNTGSDEEYAVLNRVVQENLREDTQFITIMGNHEFAVGGHEGYVRNMQSPLDVHAVVKGFHIIGISCAPKDTWHTPKQLLWMHRELKKAQADDPEKPIFTMQHGHIWNTVYVSRSWYTQMSLPLHLIYSRCPQVINFSGHSHGPINHPLSIWQNSYTQVGTGTMNYFEMERDITRQTVPDGAGRAAQYTIVEVDAQNRVRLMPFNALTGEFMKTPSTTDDPDTQLIRQVDKPGDPSTYVYTSARKKIAGKPWFNADAAVRVACDTPNAARVTFDRADDNECVYAYQVQVAPASHPGKITAETTMYAEYYFEPIPQTQSVTIDSLDAGTEYIVTVTPMNAWLQKGEPITARFTTSAEDPAS